MGVDLCALVPATVVERRARTGQCADGGADRHRWRRVLHRRLRVHRVRYIPDRSIRRGRQRTGGTPCSSQRPTLGNTNADTDANQYTWDTDTNANIDANQYACDADANIDGNQYIDYVCSWGPLIFGHAHPRVVQAVQQACERGTSFGAPTLAETALARQIVSMVPSIDMVRLVNSGTEATMSAVRVARGYTGREKIIKFSG